MEYQEFLTKKMTTAPSVGFEIEPDKLNSLLFPFQRDIVQWSLMRGRSAIFSECGTGKTAMVDHRPKSHEQFQRWKAFEC